MIVNMSSKGVWLLLGSRIRCLLGGVGVGEVSLDFEIGIRDGTRRPGVIEEICEPRCIQARAMAKVEKE